MGKFNNGSSNILNCKYSQSFDILFILLYDDLSMQHLLDIFCKLFGRPINLLLNNIKYFKLVREQIDSGRNVKLL